MSRLLAALLLLAGLLLPGGPVQATCTSPCIASVDASSADSNGFTTTSIDTTGANFLACATSAWASSPSSVSDSKSNTWISLTEKIQGGLDRIRIWYAKNATVGTGHTFTVAGTGVYPAMVCAAFSGRDTTAPFDVESIGGGGSGTSVQPGSITPSVNGELILAALAAGSNATVGYAIDSGFTNIAVRADVGGAAEGVALNYYLQPTSGAINPTMSWTNSMANAAMSASFKASAGGAAETFGFYRRRP